MLLRICVTQTNSKQSLHFYVRLFHYGVSFVRFVKLAFIAISLINEASSFFLQRLLYKPYIATGHLKEWFVLIGRWRSHQVKSLKVFWLNIVCSDELGFASPVENIFGFIWSTSTMFSPLLVLECLLLYSRKSVLLTDFLNGIIFS